MSYSRAPCAASTRASCGSISAASHRASFRLAWKAYGNPNETLGAPLTAAERERVSAMSLRELVMEIRAGDELALQLAARVCPSEGRYIGVNRHKGKFRVVLRVPGIGQRVLGQFATASQAARAFDDAAYQQFGECGSPVLCPSRALPMSFATARCSVR